jgi:acetyltransferase-like isoleucine patch superfamily enzyme
MDKFAMTPNQKEFADVSGGLLNKYKALTVGEGSWLSFLAFEFYNLFFANIGSSLGLGLRAVFLPCFLKNCASKPKLGRGIAVRRPDLISFGKNVLIDDLAVLDVRTPAEGTYKKESGAVGIEIGDNSLIGRNSILHARGGKIKLGNACNISSNCRIGTHSSVEIGESVLIAAYVYIGPANHSFEDSETPIMEQGMKIKNGVKIGKDVWIGTRATIVEGVTIGDGAVIGAHSLVLEDVPERSVVAGTPARIIRQR